MIRTQVSLEEKDYIRGKKAARDQGISFAELIRRALRQSLPVTTGAHASEKPWMRFVGIVDSGDPNSSQGIDEVLYGIKR